MVTADIGGIAIGFLAVGMLFATASKDRHKCHISGSRPLILINLVAVYLFLTIMSLF